MIMGLDLMCDYRYIGESKERAKKRLKILKKLRDELKADGFILKDSHFSLDRHMFCEYENEDWVIYIRRDGKAIHVGDANYEWRTDYPRFYVGEHDKYYDPNDKDMQQKHYFALLKCLQVHNKFYFLLQQLGD